MEKSSKTRTVFTEIQHFSRQINTFTEEVTTELISWKFLSVVAFYSTEFLTGYQTRADFTLKSSTFCFYTESH